MSSWQKQTAVAVAKEAEAAFESIAVAASPVVAYQGRDEKEESAARLMEIGD